MLLWVYICPKLMHVQVERNKGSLLHVNVGPQDAPALGRLGPAGAVPRKSPSPVCGSVKDRMDAYGWTSCSVQILPCICICNEGEDELICLR
jgi:hypothetical protein